MLYWKPLWTQEFDSAVLNSAFLNPTIMEQQDLHRSYTQRLFRLRKPLACLRSLIGYRFFFCRRRRRRRRCRRRRQL